MLFVEAGDRKKTEVRFKSALTREGTVAKKAKAKAQRAIAMTQRIARLAGEAAALHGDLDDAPNPQAAVSTADQFGISTSAAFEPQHGGGKQSSCAGPRTPRSTLIQMLS